MKSLQNQFLVAMPSLSDPYFKRSVVYLCEHNDKGAMGLVINLPVDLSLEALLTQIDLEDEEDNLGFIRNTIDQTVFQGGPVASDRGFVIHSPVKGFNSSMRLSKEIMVTTSKDVLKTLGTTEQPENFIVTLGYAAWEADQLEQEILENSWLTLPASSEIIFNTPFEDRWRKAAGSLGIEMWQVSDQLGHA